MQVLMPERETTHIRSEISEYLSGLKAVIDCLNIEQIFSVIQEMVEAYEKERNFYIFGNGGSASTASHMVVDFNKGTCRHAVKKFRVVSLNDNIPTMLAIANDIHYDEIFRMQLENHLSPGDVAIGISGSGNSKNVIRAIEYANGIGATTIGFVGFDGGRLKQIVKYCIHVPVSDMQYVEDMHLVINHLMMRIITNYIQAQNS